ncbi:MAG: DUF58 domain-containing protein [Caldisericum exile]|uniref:DUF58 domain-containing protein n=1 Tax=Caldisericum exile TaxID=693075 RepID=UPI003C74C0CB
MKLLRTLFSKHKFPYSKIKITRQGTFYILVLIILGFAAFNSGNNMIYLIFAIALSLMGVSSYLAVKNLFNIEIKVEFPQEIYANKETFISVFLVNLEKRKKFVIEVELLGKVFHFDLLEKQAKKNENFTFVRRGKYEIKKVSISSSYPFGFFTREKERIINETFYVFPEIRNVFITQKKSFQSNTLKQDNDGDFYSIDDYKEGLDARKISWKISAKLGEEKVITLANSEGTDFVVIFNNSKKMFDEDHFEIAVKKTASLTYKLFHDRINFMFISHKIKLKCASYEDYLKIMRYLSEVNLEDNEPITKTKGITHENIEFI